MHYVKKKKGFVMFVASLNPCSLQKKKKKGKKHIGVIRPRIRVRNEISRFLRFLSSSTSRLPLLDLTPDSSSPARAAQSIFQIQKGQTGSL